MSARDLAEVLSMATGWPFADCLSFVRSNRGGARRLILWRAERGS